MPVVAASQKAGPKGSSATPRRKRLSSYRVQVSSPGPGLAQPRRIGGGSGSGITGDQALTNGVGKGPVQTGVEVADGPRGESPPITRQPPTLQLVGVEAVQLIAAELLELDVPTAGTMWSSMLRGSCRRCWGGAWCALWGASGAGGSHRGRACSDWQVPLGDQRGTPVSGSEPALHRDGVDLFLRQLVPTDTWARRATAPVPTGDRPLRRDDDIHTEVMVRLRSALGVDDLSFVDGRHRPPWRRRSGRPLGERELQH